MSVSVTVDHIRDLIIKGLKNRMGMVQTEGSQDRTYCIHKTFSWLAESLSHSLKEIKKSPIN